MAFTGTFSPNLRSAESADATKLTIYDASTWGGGDLAAVTGCILSISYYDSEGVLQTYDDYDLIPGGDFTKFNEFISATGHIINLTDLFVSGVAQTGKFNDGYYILTMSFTDGTYGAYSGGLWPHIHHSDGFIAKYTFMAKKLPGSILSWPMTDEERIANTDIFLLRMYLDAAIDSAQSNKYDEFKLFLLIISNMLEYYEIEEIW